MPVGQMALATPGACCKPATRALAAVAVASSMPKAAADISGTDRKANPPVKAVRTSPRIKLDVLSGSTRVMREGIMRAAWELAKFRAKYQFVKKLFIAVCYPLVGRSQETRAGEGRGQYTVDGRHDVEDLGSDVSVHC